MSRTSRVCCAALHRPLSASTQVSVCTLMRRECADLCLALYRLDAASRRLVAAPPRRHTHPARRTRTAAITRPWARLSVTKDPLECGARDARDAARVANRTLHDALHIAVLGAAPAANVATRVATNAPRSWSCTLASSDPGPLAAAASWSGLGRPHPELRPCRARVAELCLLLSTLRGRRKDQSQNRRIFIHPTVARPA
jgi:hypothetical protein